MTFEFQDNILNYFALSMMGCELNFLRTKLRCIFPVVCRHKRVSGMQFPASYLIRARHVHSRAFWLT